MDSGLLVFIVIASGFVWYLVYRHRQNRLEEEAKAALARQREEEEEARVATACWLEIKDVFPFLPTPVIEHPTKDKIWEEIYDIFSVLPQIATVAEQGPTRFVSLSRLPVPCLPPAERKRHLYMVGKTGSGKSTFLEHLIRLDLESDRGIGVVSPEGEFFQRRLLPLVPDKREEDVIYFAPGHQRNTITFNPLVLEEGEDAARAAADLFTIFKRALGEDDLGPRMQPILQNAFAALVGRPRMTLWDVRQLLENAGFREEVIRTTADEYVRAFWLNTYPRYPKGAGLPVINRLDQFLRQPVLRKVLCHPESSLSVRQTLRDARILFVDLSGLSEESRLLIGQLLLAKLQLELMHRERTGEDSEPFYLYADEFQSFAGVAEGTWRELLSRGRKYGLCLTLAHQFPGQLPQGLQAEIFGNVHSMVAFSLGAKDAHAVRHELLRNVFDKYDKRVMPIEETCLLELATGEGYAKLGGGKAIKIRTPSPLDISHPERAQSISALSWKRYGARDEAPALAASPPPVMPERSSVREPERQEAPPVPLRQKEVARISDKPAASVREPVLPGKGGSQHKYLQHLVKRIAEDHGYRAMVEEEILGGLGSVDVALHANGTKIACEISVASTPEQELGNVQKCLASGFDHVIVVSAEKRSLAKLKEFVSAHITSETAERVFFLQPEELMGRLQELKTSAPREEQTVRGYKVKVTYRPVPEHEQETRKQAIAQVIGNAMRRLKG